MAKKPEAKKTAPAKKAPAVKKAAPAKKPAPAQKKPVAKAVPAKKPTTPVAATKIKPEAKKVASKPAAEKPKATIDFLSGLEMPSSAMIEIPLENIDPDPTQPRQAFHAADGVVSPEEQEALEQLAESIDADTQLEPIVVREKEDGRYQICAGERRWRAKKLNQSRGLPNSDTITAVLRQDLNGSKFRMAQLMENLQRRDLSDLDTAKSLKDTLEEFPELKKQDLARMLHKNSQYVSRMLALLDPRWADMVTTGIVTYASLLEQFRSLPEHKQEELKEKAKNEGRALTSGDMQEARRQAKATTKGTEGQSAQTGGAQGNEGQENPTVDANLAEQVAAIIAEQSPKNETYQPNTSEGARPPVEPEYKDHGGDATMPGGAGSLSAELFEKREVKLTVGQAIMLHDEADLLESHVVTMLLPVEEIRGAIQRLGKEAPEDNNLLVMGLVTALNEKLKA